MKQRGVRIYVSPLYYPGALFLALEATQLVLRVNHPGVASRNALLLLATDFIFFFVAGQVFADASPNTYSKFGRMVAIYAGALGLFAIFEAVSSPGLIYWSIRPNGGAVFGPYVNHNDYAGLMEMLIPVAAAYAVTRRRGSSHRSLALIVVAIATASLLLSGSRGGIVALLAETTLFTTLCFRLKQFKPRNYSVLGGAWVLCAAIALSIWLAPTYLYGRIEVTLGQRLMATRDTLRIARDNPWLGTGLGSFQDVFPRYQSFASNDIWQHAHDDFAEALAETGLIGGLLLLAELIVFIRTAFGKLDERLNTSAGWIQLGCGLGCCGMLVHGFADFNFHIPANAAWFAICAGLASAPVVPNGKTAFS